MLLAMVETTTMSAIVAPLVTVMDPMSLEVSHLSYSPFKERV
jgi:hypothetical protein